MHFWLTWTHWLHSIYPQSLKQSPIEQATAVTIFHPFFTVLPLSISNGFINLAGLKNTYSEKTKSLLQRETLNVYEAYLCIPTARCCKIWGTKSSHLILFLLSPLSWPQNNCYLSVWQTIRPDLLPQHSLSEETRTCFAVLSPSKCSNFEGAAESSFWRTESTSSSPSLSSSCSWDFIQLLSSSWATMKKEIDDFTCLKKLYG